MIHVAAVDGLARLMLESEVSLVVELLEVTYHPVVTSNVTDVKPVQPEKAEKPMLVTLSGIMMDIKPVQP